MPETAAAPTAVRSPGERLSLTAWVIAALHVLLHLLTNGNYGIFRDELYYLACADHLDWGYVDHPPLSIFLLWLERAVIGDSVEAIRVLPALVGGALVMLAAALAREMGGKHFAQTLGALAVAIVPQYQVITGYYSMNAYDLLFWALAAWLVLRIQALDEPRLWLLFGVLAGVALQNKYSILFFAAGLAVAFPFTSLRRHLKSPWLWAGAGIALLIVLPHVLWQIHHEWPTREFVANATSGKIVRLTPLEYFLAQIDEIHPVTLPLWLLGLGFLLAKARLRVLGIVYLVAFLILALQTSKPYYLGPAYTMLLAAGATAFGGFLEGRRGRRIFQALAVSTLLVGGAIALPFVVPLLPVERFVAYQEALGMTPSSAETHRLGALPQHYADRFGWPEIAAATARAWETLSPEEQQGALIVASNYGEAGAIDYFGDPYGLPRAVSQHNSYYLWGPIPKGRIEPPGNVAILVGFDPEDEGLRAAFESLTPAGRIEAPFAMPYETAHPILIGRGLRLPLEDAWQQGKNYN